MVWFWIVLFNWRTHASRVPRSNCLPNGLVLFIKASAMDFYMRLGRMQIPVQVVYIFHDVSGINPFWMWKHGLRTQSSAILTAPASPVVCCVYCYRWDSPLSSDLRALNALSTCTRFWFGHIWVLTVQFLIFFSHTGSIYACAKYFDLHSKEHNF